MNRKFLIADTHFGDENIINFENRPFENAEEMDEKLIENWVNTVDDEDTIYVLGDIFSKNDVEYITSILERVKGNIIVVKGNHDSEDILNFVKSFERVTVYDYPIVVDNFWILSHEPMYVNTNSPYANIFGHVHADPKYVTYSSRSACVSVERTNYTPILLEEVKRKVLEYNK